MLMLCTVSFSIPIRNLNLGVTTQTSSTLLGSHANSKIVNRNTHLWKTYYQTNHDQGKRWNKKQNGTLAETLCGMEFKLFSISSSND